MHKLLVVIASSWSLLAVHGQAALTNGLVRYYTFDGDTLDHSGAGQDINFVSAISTEDRFGRPGKAFAFDGSTSYLKASADGLPSGDRTVSIWFNAATAVNGRGLLAYGGQTCGRSFLMDLNNQDKGKNQYETQAHCEVNRLFAPMGTNAVGVWHQLSVTISEELTTMYVDGIQIGSGNVYTQATVVNGTDLIIGQLVGGDGKGNYYDGNVSPFFGSLDDVRIYNRALSMDEVHSLYESERALLTNEVPSLAIDLLPRLNLSGNPGSNYLIQYRNNVGSGTNWMTLTNLNLVFSPMTWIDFSAIGQPTRLYRAVQQ